MYTKSVYYVQNPYFKYNNCLICVYFVFQKKILVELSESNLILGTKQCALY